MLKTKKPIEIYTDGSEKGSFGSWAFVIVQNGKVLTEAFGREKKTTSYRMEFQAAIEALKVLEKSSRVTLYTDCRILVDTMTLWSKDWKANGWVKPKGQKIPNVDIIIALDYLSQNHKIEWKWVKAHSGKVHNERADELCIAARS